MKQLFVNININQILFFDDKKLLLDNHKFNDLKYYYLKYGNVPHIDLKQDGEFILIDSSMRKSSITIFLIAKGLGLDCIDAKLLYESEDLIEKLLAKDMIKKITLDDLRKKEMCHGEGGWFLQIFFFDNLLEKNHIEWITDEIFNFYNTENILIIPPLTQNKVKNLSYNNEMNCIEFYSYISEFTEDVERQNRIKYGFFINNIHKYQKIRRINNILIDDILGGIKYS